MEGEYRGAISLLQPCTINRENLTPPQTKILATPLSSSSSSCVCVYVCMWHASNAGIVSKRRHEPGWYFARRFSSTYAMLCFREIRVCHFKNVKTRFQIWEQCKIASRIPYTIPVSFVVDRYYIQVNVVVMVVMMLLQLAATEAHTQRRKHSPAQISQSQIADLAPCATHDV